MKIQLSSIKQDSKRYCKTVKQCDFSIKFFENIIIFHKIFMTAYSRFLQ